MEDRKSLHPGRVKLIPVDVANGIYDMVMADEPVQVGTPLNKETLLSDETAEQLAISDPQARTVNNALVSLDESITALSEDMNVQVGNVLNQVDEVLMEVRGETLHTSGGVMYGDINMSGVNTITQLKLPTNSTDAANKKYVDDQIPDLDGYVPKSGATMTGDLSIASGKSIKLLGTQIISGSSSMEVPGVVLEAAQNTVHGLKIQSLLKSGTRSDIKITGILAPSASNQAANKQYVDAKAVAKRTARFVVGTSTAGWTANDCNYLCDGTADDVEINAAIQALPSNGGEVIILDGTYTLTAPININKDYVTLSGNGKNTVLKRNFTGSASAQAMISVVSSYNIVQFLNLDGVVAAFSGSNNHAINLSQNGFNTITNNFINNAYFGICLSNSANNIITGNVSTNHSSSGIYIDSNGTNNIVSHNNCNSNTSYGIYLLGSINTTVTSNLCSGSNNTGIYLNNGDFNTITSNHCSDNRNGIYLSGASTTIISNNICSNNSTNGICVSSSAQYNTINGNVCVRGTGQSSDYSSSQRTIYIMGSNNLVTGNMIMGKNYSYTSTTNTFANNKYN